ncbi:protein of unknown function [Nitrospira japonica]|uniref:Uncharacterized protein n=1 Tax=Nitrospira japonica TaxID=1325564 RepID=A0A1W1I2D6_9BACT|nr:hypothetical protein [Nitrospira japonica]SLM47029.1 protein of unknown function [Nitrospira japonica]
MEWIAIIIFAAASFAYGRNVGMKHGYDELGPKELSGMIDFYSRLVRTEGYETVAARTGDPLMRNLVEVIHEASKHN